MRSVLVGANFVLQVSRFDRFKDPIGVIAAFREVRKMVPAQLVLAGGGATDDTESSIVLRKSMKQREVIPISISSKITP